ncbi:MAG: DUF3011 domain-containing protein, partial [Duganella sp.]
LVFLQLMHALRPLSGLVMSFYRRTVCVLLIGALMAGPRVAIASDTVTCESRHGRYNYCRVDTDGKVELTRELSRGDCREGRSWGYDNRGVWVDRGCSAEFRVGRDSKSDKHAAVAAGVIGLALIAALAAKNNQQRQEHQEQQDIQPWSVGSFSAFDQQQRTMVEINVQPGGAVSARARGESITGSMRGDLLTVGHFTFRIQPAGNGFQAVDQADPSHQLTFQRVSGGY